MWRDYLSFDQRRRATDIAFLTVRRVRIKSAAVGVVGKNRWNPCLYRTGKGEPRQLLLEIHQHTVLAFAEAAPSAAVADKPQGA